MTEQRSFTIQLAEKRICIKPLYDMIREYCKEYIVSDICENTEKAGGSENEDKTVNPFADLIIQTSPEDIAYERKRSAREADQNGPGGRIHGCLFGNSCRISEDCRMDADV